MREVATDDPSLENLANRGYPTDSHPFLCYKEDSKIVDVPDFNIGGYVLSVNFVPYQHYPSLEDINQKLWGSILDIECTNITRPNLQHIHNVHTVLNIRGSTHYLINPNLKAYIEETNPRYLSGMRTTEIIVSELPEDIIVVAHVGIDHFDAPGAYIPNDTGYNVAFNRNKYAFLKIKYTK